MGLNKFTVLVPYWELYLHLSLLMETHRKSYRWMSTLLFSSAPVPPCVNTEVLCLPTDCHLFSFLSSGNRSCSSPHYSTLHQFDPTALPRLYLTHASIFFLNIHIPTKCSDDEACMLILPGQLTASGPVSDQRCGHDRCLHKERHWSEVFIVT